MNAPLESEVLLSIPHGRELEIQKSPRYRWDNAVRGSHEYVILQWTISGTGIFEEKGKTYEVGEGKAFLAFIPEKSIYYFPAEAKEPWTYLWIDFQGALAMQLWRKVKERFGPILSLSGNTALRREAQYLIHQTRERHWSSRWEESEACYRFYLSMVNHLEGTSEEKGGALVRAKDYLHLHFRTPVAVKELANQYGMSREHFTREFQRSFGESPGEYLRKLRLEEAGRLLRETSIPIQEVARRSGFASSTRMGLWFQQQYRKSPKSYRKVKK